MTLQRSPSETLLQIRNRCRDECEDPSSDPATNTIPTAGLEFSDAQYGRAINDACKFLALRASVEFPGEALVMNTLTYSETTEPGGSLLPTGTGDDPIIGVEILDTTFARQVFWADPQEIEQYVSNYDSATRPMDRFYYTLQSDAISGGNEVRRIRIRPNPGNLTFRIWSIAAPVISSLSSDSDVIIFSARWADLIALLGSLILLRRSGRSTSQQEAGLAGWLTLFDQEVSRRAEPEHVRFPAGRGL